MTEDELRKKVELLERENARLKAAKRPSDYSVREDEFKGHPVLVFEGPSLIKPMTLGIGKLKAISASSAQIRDFLVRHGGLEAEKAKSHAPDGPDRI